MQIIILWSLNLTLFITCLILKRKIKIIPLAILTLTVTFFQILTPNGKILLSIGNFNITLGSLKAGLIKSGILIFLHLLSKLIVSLNIKFSGKTGAFLTDVFQIYEKLTDDDFIQNESKTLSSDCQNSQIPQKKDKLSRFIDSLDAKFIKIWKQI